MATVTAKSPTSGVTVRVIDNGMDATTLAQWVDYGYFEFAHIGLFRALVGGVNVVEPNSPSAPTQLRYSPTNTSPQEGHFDPVTWTIWISSQADVWAVLWHEFGHVLQKAGKVLPDGSPLGRALLALYGVMTNRPQAEWVEWMATDFRRRLFETLPFPEARAFFEAVAAAGGI